MRLALLALALPALVACGAKKSDAYKQANIALLSRVPAYPGAASPRTTTSGASSTEFGARDWTLPAHARAAAVIRWYERALQARGWKLVDEGDAALRATRGNASLSLGVRGRTVEAIVNSRGA